MKRSNMFVILIGWTAVIALATGCADQGQSGGGSDHAPTSSSSGDSHDGHDHDGHDHDGHDHEGEHEGPHGGHVVELGRNHEYHAELVEDEAAGSVTVYILDKDLKELPIAQSSIAMNLVVDGKAKSFELAASNAQAGKASRFDASGQELFEALHEHEASGKLRVTIDDAPYSGPVEHHHHHGDDDHDDHEHADHEHADHEHRP